MQTERTLPVRLNSPSLRWILTLLSRYAKLPTLHTAMLLVRVRDHRHRGHWLWLTAQIKGRRSDVNIRTHV